MMFLPEVNTEVVVAFEQGDVNHPYVVGSLWNGTKKPPKAPTAVVDGSTGEVKERILKTRSGHIITINDSNDAPQIVARPSPVSGTNSVSRIHSARRRPSSTSTANQISNHGR